MDGSPCTTAFALTNRRSFHSPATTPTDVAGSISRGPGKPVESVRIRPVCLELHAGISCSRSA